MQSAPAEGVGENERQRRMCRSDHELDFGMMLEAKLAQSQSPPRGGRTALRVFVRDVSRVGAAQRCGTALLRDSRSRYFRLGTGSLFPLLFHLCQTGNSQGRTGSSNRPCMAN